MTEKMPPKQERQPKVAPTSDAGQQQTGHKERMPGKRRSTKTVGGVIAVTGSFIILVGSLLPWVTAAMVCSCSVLSMSGMDGDGKITFPLGFIAIVGAVLILSYEKTKVWQYMSALAAVAVIPVCIINLADISGRFPDMYEGSPGLGLYMVLAGGIVAFIGAVIASARPKEKSEVGASLDV